MRWAFDVRWASVPIDLAVTRRDGLGGPSYRRGAIVPIDDTTFETFSLDGPPWFRQLGPGLRVRPACHLLNDKVWVPFSKPRRTGVSAISHRGFAVTSARRSSLT